MLNIRSLQKTMLSFLFIASICCNKSESPSPDGKLEIVSDLSMANVQNGLQAVHTTADNRYKTYFYGSFNDKGIPLEIKEVNMYKPEGDSSLNMVLDSAKRVKYLFISAKGMKANELIVFDYSESGKTIVRVIQLDFTGTTSKVIYQTTVDNSSLKLESEARYASFASGFMKLLNVMTTNVDLFIDLRNQMGAFWTQVAFRTVIAIGTGGCILTAPIGIGVLCATAGYILIRPIKEAFGDAPSTPISTPPSDAPPSPSRQTENTQLQRLRLGTGTRRSYTFQYGGGQYCSYIGEYSNMIMGVRVTSAGDAISDAWLRFYQKETKTDPGCAPTLPVLPQNEHDYQFQSGNITNNNLTIQFRYMTGTPRCNVTFSGTRVGNSFSGQLFFDRNDGVVSTTDYFIAIPMVVQFL